MIAKREAPNATAAVLAKEPAGTARKTKGGPVDSTEVIVYFLYQQAFQHFKIGYAFAIAYILFVIIFVLTLAQWKMGKASVHYQ